MQFIRKAGERIRQFDDAYSDKIAALYENAHPAVVNAGYLVGGASPSTRLMPVDTGPEPFLQAMGRGLEYAIPAMNAVPKYVIPAAGVTAAGIGIHDLVQLLGAQQTEGTIKP